MCLVFVLFIHYIVYIYEKYTSFCIFILNLYKIYTFLIKTMDIKKPSLSKRIVNTLNRDTRKRKSAYVYFLPLHDEIEEALNKDWSVQVIWQVLNTEGKFPFGYQTLMKLVNKHIYRKGKETRETTKSIIKEDNKTTKPINPNQASEGFTFTSQIDEKEII